MNINTINIRVFLYAALVVFSGFASVVNAAEITWSLYLKPYINDGPVLSATMQDGQEFTIEDVQLTGGQSRCSDLLDDLEGTTFLIQQSPTGQPLEIRIILNVQGDTFENAGGIPTFLNINFGAYINGNLEDRLRFSAGSPMIMTIPEGSGLHNLLEKGNCSRGDNIKFVFYSGGKFDTDGINTYNKSSGLIAHIDRTSTVVGGLGEDFGYPANSGFNTWGKIKQLFR